MKSWRTCLECRPKKWSTSNLRKPLAPTLAGSDSVRDAFLNRTTDSESVAFSLSDLLERFLTARNCMSLILKMKTSAESGL
jgi:hypothetical protein